MLKIDNLDLLHYDIVREIYEEGIATGNATFQETSSAWEEWDKSHLAHSRIICVENDNVIGWAALTPVSGRCVYAGVAEVSVYVKENARGKGVGIMLMKALIAESEQNNIWTLQAGIFPENEASIALHEKFGFRKVGYREKIGRMKDIWRDTVLLERRSSLVGV